MDRLSAPLSIGIIVNSVCDLDCKYCYAQPFLLVQMQTANALNIMRQAKDLGVFKVTIEGGEPFLHKDLFKILDYTLSLGFESDLVSNGTQITENIAKKLKKLSDKYDGWTGVQISLDSVNPEINNRTRGRGEKVKENLERLLRLNVPTSLGTVVTHSNAAELEGIVDKYYPAVKNFHFIRVMPTWKSLPNFNKLALTKDDYSLLDIAYEKFDRMMRNDPNLEITLLKDKNDFPNSPEKSNFPCTGGHTQLIIRPDLLVATCDLSLNITVGNLKEQSLKAIWDGIALKILNEYDVRPCVLSLGTNRQYSILPNHIEELYSLKREGKRKEVEATKSIVVRR